jgi:hypothetical protein
MPSTPTPPFCSDCATKTEPAAGGPPAQSASRMWRSSDGKMRFDTPNASIISDPGSQRTILLDHLKKEASIFPMPLATTGAQVPGMPQVPAANLPKPPVMQVEDLGKSTIEGHEVEGKRYTLPAIAQPAKPQTPSAPSVPSAPGAPSTPSLPGGPKPPSVPTLPSKPSVTEVWTSVKLKAPVLTKLITAAGQQTTYCKPTSADEPHPSVFQIPPEYNIKSKP